MKEDKLNNRQLAAVRAIRNWTMNKGRTPSVRELMNALDYKSPRSVQDILQQLLDNGIIRKFSNGSYQLTRDPDLGPMNAQTVNVPIVGIVAAGTPVYAEENIDGYLPVSINLAKQGHNYFLLRVKGDSMNEAGINDSDLVLVRQQSTANNNDKVVALINDEATVKEINYQEGVIVLRPRSSNKKHTPIILKDDFQIQGKVIATIQKFEE